MNSEQLEKMAQGSGFVAALDQSGGSTPKALQLYGVGPDQYGDDATMFDLVHQMRTRIITSPAFTGDKILGAILFEQTMDRDIAGQPTADYLWQVKHIVPFLKVDKGLAEEANGAKTMKPMPDLGDLLRRAVANGIFGTKMRSVISAADPAGVLAVVDQQFEVAQQILDQGLMPIIEPEVDIHAVDKAAAEDLLKAALLRHLDGLGEQVMLKLTIPTQAGFYTDVIDHPKVLRVVALSGGYSRAEANALLAQNPGLIASFSRALSEGLSVEQSDAEFDQTLADSIDGIYQASST